MQFSHLKASYRAISFDEPKRARQEFVCLKRLGTLLLHVTAQLQKSTENDGLTGHLLQNVSGVQIRRGGDNSLIKGPLDGSGAANKYKARH